jgi:hypothetical protein
MTRRRPSRRGYALILVATFSLLFVTFMGVAWRQLASAIGTFSARSNQIQQDMGAMMALADAMRALEVGPPPYDANGQYQCYWPGNTYWNATVPAMQNARIQWPQTTAADYPQNPQSCYYQLTFQRTIAGQYTVTAEKVPAQGVPLFDINNFGTNNAPL